MNQSPTHVLFVFNSACLERQVLLNRIRECQQYINQVIQAEGQSPTLYILYCLPYSPTYAMQSVDLQQYVINQQQLGKQLLKQVSKVLAVPASHRFMAVGSSDLQAYSVAKRLGVSKVIGYSRVFLSGLQCLESLKKRWSVYLSYFKVRLLSSH